MAPGLVSLNLCAVFGRGQHRGHMESSDEVSHREGKKDDEDGQGDGHGSQPVKSACKVASFCHSSCALSMALQTSTSAVRRDGPRGASLRCTSTRRHSLVGNPQPGQYSLPEEILKSQRQLRHVVAHFARAAFRRARESDTADKMRLSCIGPQASRASRDLQLFKAPPEQPDWRSLAHSGSRAHSAQVSPTTAVGHVLKLDRQAVGVAEVKLWRPFRRAAAIRHAHGYPVQ